MGNQDSSAVLTKRAAEEYNGLLIELEQVTERLTTAVNNWDSETVDDLVKTRQLLCEKLTPSAKNLGVLLQNDRKSLNINDKELQEIITQLEARQNSLLEKQAECESALSAGLDKCRVALVGLAQQRSLHGTYNNASSSKQARFLDSRR